MLPMLPTTRHVKELIEHSEEHVKLGSEKDLKIALIHVDNSIEVMLKEYLRFEKEKTLGEIERLSFHELIKGCPDIAVVKSSKNLFVAFHDIRNAIYHSGMLAPQKKDVESAIDLAKSLFNELHPNTGFETAQVTLPSKESIKTLPRYVGNKQYIEELRVIQGFLGYMHLNGYIAAVEYSLNDKDRYHYRADLVAFKGKEVIVCEFKLRFIPIHRAMIINKLHVYMTLLAEKFPEKTVKGWLVIYGEEVTLRSSDIESIKRLGIRLIALSEVNEIMKEQDEERQTVMEQIEEQKRDMRFDVS
jgi:hypothetical protein